MTRNNKPKPQAKKVRRLSREVQSVKKTVSILKKKSGSQLRKRSRSMSSAGSRSSFRSASSLRKAVKGTSRSYASSQDCWLYGMLEPEHASRGPPVEDNEVATVVIPYKSYTEFKTTPNPVIDPAKLIGDTGSWNYYLDSKNTTGTYTDNFHPENPYMHNSAGDICICACPHFITQNFLDPDYSTASLAPNAGFDPRYPKDSTGQPARATATPNFRMASGFTCDPLVDTGTGGVYWTSTDKAAETAKPYPLSYFNLDMPYVPDEFGDLVQVAYRCVGLKLTCTVNTPALTAVGSVRAGDNRANQSGQTKLYAPSTQEVPFAIVSDGNKNSNVPFMSRINEIGQGAQSLGAITSGNTYEVVWMPKGMAAMAYNQYPLRQTALCQKLGAANPPGPATPDMFDVTSYWPSYGGAIDSNFKMTRGDLIENNPFAYIVFSGFDPTAGLSLSVGITAAFEFQLTSGSTLAQMYSDFAFVEPWVPRFCSLLSQVNSSNWMTHGSVVARAMKGSEKDKYIRGAKCAQHIVAERPLLKPPRQLMGAGAVVAEDSILSGPVDPKAVLTSLAHGNQSTKRALYTR